MITLIFDFNIKKWNNDSTMESYHEWRENNVVCCIVYFWCCKLHTAVVWILTADIRYIAIHWIHIAMHLAASCKNHRRIKLFCKIIKVMSYKYENGIYLQLSVSCFTFVAHFSELIANTRYFPAYNQAACCCTHLLSFYGKLICQIAGSWSWPGAGERQQ